MSHERDALEIEPLDEQCWDRVEQRVFAEVDASRAMAPAYAPRTERPAKAPVWNAAALVLAGALAAIGGVVAEAWTPHTPRAIAPSPEQTPVRTADPPAPAASSVPVTTDAPPARNVAPPVHRQARAPAPPSAPLPATPPPTAIEPSAVEPPAPTNRSAYEAAARLEGTDWAAALERYHELSRGTDSWAANALFAEGRLALDRGDRERGTRALRQYLERFPSGQNAADARDLLRHP